MNKPRRVKGNIKKYCEISDNQSQEQQNCPTINQYKQKKKVENIKSCEIQTVSNAEHRYNKMRYAIVNGFSKFQKKKELRMESMFLAVDLFDRCRDLMKIQQMASFAVAAIMLAMKYEEIYPPDVAVTSEHFRVWMNFKNYVAIELQILNKVDFNLNIGSPISLLLQLGSIPHESQDWYKAMLLLEIAVVNNQIKSRYSWQEITKAISIIFKPLNSCLEEEVPEKISLCCKKIMIERSRLEENYYWLNSKYMSSKFNGVASKGYSIKN